MSMDTNILKNRFALSKILIVVIVVAVVVVIGIGAFLLSNQNQNNPNPEPTSTPTQSTTTSVQPTISTSPTTSSITPTQTPTLTPAATPSSSISVSEASSLQYRVSLIENGQLMERYTYYGKNIGTTNFMMRIEHENADSGGVIIINGAQQKAWSNTDGVWEDNSAMFSMQYNTWNTLWQGYLTHLGAWSGVGEVSYTEGATTVGISQIIVNPNLADSLFEHLPSI